MQLSDTAGTYVHIISIVISIVVGIVGLYIRNALLTVANTCDRINARIEKHEALCDEKNKEVERRFHRIEKRLEIDG